MHEGFPDNRFMQRKQKKAILPVPGLSRLSSLIFAILLFFGMASPSGEPRECSGSADEQKMAFGTFEPMCADMDGTCIMKPTEAAFSLPEAQRFLSLQKGVSHLQRYNPVWFAELRDHRR